MFLFRLIQRNRRIISRLKYFKEDKRIDECRKRLLEKEYRFCKKKRRLIQKTYMRVKNNLDDELTKNSCDFALLEKAYVNYIKEEKYNDIDMENDK